ncbi:thioredoxin-like [Cheilinus undulatus]|uniref:thioredoxin-like n=1 Tax=Cheilinus undulatus TaxID=241271 RepID=UPI001BD47308|nr:thioredoxin-like [Cheilinus undulatus]
MVKKVNTKEEFDSVLREAGDKVVVVDFTAAWCGPCRMIAPKFEEASEKYTDMIFIKVDVDECSDVAAECKISCMPTFVFFKNGKEVNRFSGADEGNLLKAIEKNR